MSNSIVYPTTPEQRQLLREAGFVHVTELRVPTKEDPEKIGHQYTIRAGRQGCPIGKYGIASGFMVLTTMGGEVWIAHQPDEYKLKRGLGDQRNTIFQLLCPGGEGDFILFPAGSDIDSHSVLSRVTDPDCLLF